MTAERARRDIGNTLSSYNNYWDILAELAQNARDAINRKREAGAEFTGKISLHINYQDRSIEILDNGCGIGKSHIATCLSSAGSDKKPDGPEIGHKGVGLTFCLFKGNRFEVESKHTDGSHYRALVVGANNWLQSKGDEQPPQAKISDMSGEPENSTFGKLPSKSFTLIKISEIAATEGCPDIFDMTRSQLEFLLLTKTAFGDTNSLFDENLTPSFQFSFSCSLSSEIEAESETQDLKPTFPAIHESIVRSVSLDEAVNKLASLDTSKKKTFLMNKVVYHKETIGDRDRNRISVYAVMFPGNGTFENLSNNALNIKFSNEEFQENNALFHSGIFVATKGMPTGIEIQPNNKCKYPAYYKRCYFIVQADTLLFDTGRKKLSSDSQKKRLKEAVASTYRRLEEIVMFQSGKSEGKTQDSKKARKAKLQEQWTAINNSDPLELTSIKYGKSPQNQEAGVVAIFHELLGANILKSYRPLHSGYGARYDLFADYLADGKTYKIVIEFKHSLDKICKDFEEETKFFDDVDLLIAWDADRKKLDSFNLELTPVEPDESEYEGANYTLNCGSFNEISVILLKDFIGKLI